MNRSVYVKMFRMMTIKTDIQVDLKEIKLIWNRSSKQRSICKEISGLLLVILSSVFLFADGGNAGVSLMSLTSPQGPSEMALLQPPVSRTPRYCFELSYSK